MKFSQKRILIVDDDQDVRIILRDFLEFHGFSCKEAGDGKEAIDLLHIYSFDLIVTDYQMPVMNGLMLLGNLMKTPMFRDIPVIMVTGLFSEEFCEEALQLGAYAVMEKPYSRKDFLAQINKALINSSRTCLECL